MKNKYKPCADVEASNWKRPHVHGTGARFETKFVLVTYAQVELKLAADNH